MDERPFNRPQHSLHSPKRLPTGDSDTGPQLRCATFEGDQETAFVRLAGHCAREAHGSAATPTIHEGYDCGSHHRREAGCRKQTAIIPLFLRGRYHRLGLFEEVRVVHTL